MELVGNRHVYQAVGKVWAACCPYLIHSEVPVFHKSTAHPLSMMMLAIGRWTNHLRSFLYGFLLLICQIFVSVPRKKHFFESRGNRSQHKSKKLEAPSMPFKSSLKNLYPSCHFLNHFCICHKLSFTKSLHSFAISYGKYRV